MSKKKRKQKNRNTVSPEKKQVINEDVKESGSKKEPDNDSIEKILEDSPTEVLEGILEEIDNPKAGESESESSLPEKNEKDNLGDTDSDLEFFDINEAATSSDNGNAIVIKDLCKSYRLYRRGSDRLKESLGLTKKVLSTEKKALDNVSFSVKRGETVGIIGTNGSGKSTILKIITGVLHPTSGVALVDGRISALLELGAGFNQEYTGLENVYLNGTMMGYSDKEIDEKLPAILEFADIGDYIYQPVKTYSSGMFVRLAFAVAINIDPEILIVDEALSVGDVFFQSKCYHKFEEFKKQGKTILFVSHDLSSISKYCDRVVLLNKGVKLGEGSPKEMIDIYKRVLVGQYDAENNSGVNNESADAKNPHLLEYGDGSAHMDEYYITDEGGIRTSSIVKGSRFTVHMDVSFAKDVNAPIFAFSLKNIKGTEITGTNTMFEKAFLEPVKKGDKKKVTFEQEMNLQGGEYLLSLGVTGFEGDDFKVYHRLYDCINITVVSDKDTVGFYDMNSVITVK